MQSTDFINILVAGKYGCGKSTLVNGLLGHKVSELSPYGIIHTEVGVLEPVIPTEFEHNGIKGVVYDTKGMLDSSNSRSEVIQQIRVTYADVDLVLLCIRMPEARFEDHDDQGQIIKLLEVSLGPDVWKKTVVPLVFANQMVSELEQMRGEMSIKDAFQHKLKSWESVLNKRLPGYHGVIPTGHSSVAKILEGDKYHWLTKFWEKCCLSLQDNSKKAALVQLNAGRFTEDVEVAIGNLEDTKITITKEVAPILRKLS